MRLKFAVFLLVLAHPAFVFGQKPDEPIARLRQMRVQSSIDGPEMKPWRLKMEFQLFDAKGVQTDVGTIEEWWAFRGR